MIIYSINFFLRINRYFLIKFKSQFLLLQLMYHYFKRKILFRLILLIFSLLIIFHLVSCGHQNNFSNNIPETSGYTLSGGLYQENPIDDQIVTIFENYHGFPVLKHYNPKNYKKSSIKTLIFDDNYLNYRGKNNIFTFYDRYDYPVFFIDDEIEAINKKIKQLINNPSMEDIEKIDFIKNQLFNRKNDLLLGNPIIKLLGSSAGGWLMFCHFMQASRNLIIPIIKGLTFTIIIFLFMSWKSESVDYEINNYITNKYLEYSSYALDNKEVDQENDYNYKYLDSGYNSHFGLKHLNINILELVQFYAYIINVFSLSDSVIKKFCFNSHDWKDTKSCNDVITRFDFKNLHLIKKNHDNTSKSDADTDVESKDENENETESDDE